MKVREVRVAGLRGATPPGGWSDELRPEDVVHTLVAVHTDEGLVGVGSVFSTEDLVRASLRVLSPLLVGEEAVEPERVSEKLHRATFWLGRGGAITHTISGVDIALWDLLGQATGQPVGRLMGGRWREAVPVYASLLMDEPAKLTDVLSRARERGFRAFKIGWGPFGRRSSRVDEEIVAAARAAIGDEAKLMVDAGGSDGRWQHGLSWARRTANMLAAYGVEWFEEPLVPDAIDDYARLRGWSPVPISGCEVLTRRQSFVPWIERGAVDIVQPDVTKVGGLSEERRIAWLASEHGVRFVPHGWNTAVGLGADLQLASALPEAEFVEYLDGSPYIDELVASPWRLDPDGALPIPEGPGLGLTLDPDVVGRYTGGVELLAP